jgi:phage gp36-like protein
MAAYASIADLVKRYDVRTIGELIKDDGTAANSAAVTADANGIIAAALETASGEVESACLRGKRYTVTDLAGLTGNSQALLKHLTCKIAFWLLWERRPVWDQDQYEQAKNAPRGMLDQLKRGESIFEVAAVETAGNPSVTGPTRADLSRLNLIRDRMHRYYPDRHLPGE